MRRIGRWTLVFILLAGSWTPAFAQAKSDKWDVVVTPYVMGASMRGMTTVRGFDVDVNVPASEIFSNLQFGAMGVVTARKGNWGLGSDLIWMALGATVEETNVDFNQGAFAFYGMRRLGAAADVTFGMRVNTLQGTLTFKRGEDAARNQDKTWADPIVGVVLRSPAEKRMTLKLYSEIGGFGAGSTFTWQLFPNVDIRLTERASADFGYRWLDIDYATSDGTEKFRYDVLTQGPVVGFALRF